MSFALGVLLFAVGIGLSIALHEAGHMWSAKAFGMRVRRYFIGFGPKVFSFRRGDTEYGLKWIPAGGFCDIAGMTALDPVTTEEAPRAFFKKATWKRVVVLSAGSGMHFLIGIVLLYVLAVAGALPNSTPVVAQVAECVPPATTAAGALPTCQPGQPAPAKAAGMQVGDVITSVAGTPVSSTNEAQTIIQGKRGPVPVVVERAGRPVTLTIDVVPMTSVDPTTKASTTTGRIGVSFPFYQVLNPVTAVPATFLFTGEMFSATWQGLIMFPEKVPAVLKAIGGAPPDVNRPVSVVGASIIGGDAAQAGQWAFFLLLLAALNFFVGVFNLVPLLPLDGGHIAVNLYERARDSVRRRLGKAKMPPVDYTRLLPVTYAFILVLGAISLLTITADIVNPIRLPQ
ncbi:MAG TPA: site-2 protease family protein [Pseudonocardia sp.]|uniref:M50 family metallopeptidase n=1 Tax=Pseudonocardia sp. TaxID=60912 RepID=UPI002ED9CFE6